MTSSGDKILRVNTLITFCDQTISKGNEKIRKAKAELHAKLDRSEREKIISILEKNSTENT